MKRLGMVLYPASTGVALYKPAVLGKEVSETVTPQPQRVSVRGEKAGCNDANLHSPKNFPSFSLMPPCIS